MELPSDDPLFLRQVELELYMQGRGAIRYRKAVEKAKERGRLSEADPGLLLLKHTVEPVADAIVEFTSKAKSGSAGNRLLSAKMIRDMDPKTVAYLVTRRCVDYLQIQPRLVSAAVELASIIEHEARFANFAASHPALFASLLKHLDRLSSDAHKRKAMSIMVGKFNDPWVRWTHTEKLHLGTKLLTIFADVTGFFEFRSIKVRRAKTEKRIFPSATVDEWLTKRQLRGEIMLPFLLPMIYPPKPWDDTFQGGGYWTDVIPSMPLVKGGSKRQRGLMKEQDMSLVLSAVNSLQATPWVVNTPVLEVLDHFWTNGIAIADLPPNDDEPLPPKPHDIETNAEARKEWRKSASAVHTRNAKQRSVRMQITRTIEVARMYRDEEAIYFPYQLDFRGRAYVVGGGISPQGADYSRALLTFANGKSILSEVDATWLKIHGANSFGEDKISLDDRAEWVNENEATILACAKDPYRNLWWTEADKPWSFLAFCFEYAGFVEHGYGFVSSLPIALDGTCNGLQHFSAMLRDPIGGRAVNLVPSDKPQDIYSEVAKVVTEKLTAEDRDEFKWIAQTWLQIGIDRKVTKRPVMVLPYGGTRFSCLKYVRAAFEEKVPGDSPFGDDTNRAVAYLAGLVWDSIGDVVVAARDAMSWLQSVAKIAGQHVSHLTWLTPANFPVVQAYREFKSRRVKTAMGDSFVFLSIREPTDKLDRGKQVLAVSPNFVHSMDASAMMETIRLCRESDVDSFAMIHDSYGTVAADTDLMAISLRLAFVEMYRRDVLDEFRQSVIESLPEEAHELIPPVPAKGSLDIDQVLESAFFFS